MKTSIFLGFAGDIFTFVGGFILAWDALRRHEEFRKAKNLQSVVTRFAGLDISQGDVRLSDSGSVELLFISRSVRRALWGTAIVTLGFLCLLAARITEMLGQGKH